MEILIIVILVGVVIYGLMEKREKKGSKLDSDLAVQKAQKDNCMN